GQSSMLLLIPVALTLLAARALTLAALASKERPAIGPLCQAALGQMPAFLLIAGVTLLAQVLVLGAASFLGTRPSAALGGARSEVRGDLAFVACLILGLFFSALLGAVSELARARVSQHGTRARRALLLSLSSLRGRLRQVLRGWGTPALASLALVLLSAWLTQLLDVGRPGSLRVWGVLLLHQLVAFALVWLHSFWLSSALRLSLDEA
ncbi:MAG TPA: hypothetical protein VGP93_14985, partial [Polyangiaceae bacterium]|nr:hypothetical protein [Polyangiaceae bacterium]